MKYKWIFFLSFLGLISCKLDRSIIYEDGFVETADGIQLYYTKIGNGSEQIIVPSGMYLQSELSQLGKRSRTIIFYHQRGRGLSSKPKPEQVTLANEIADIEAIRAFFDFDEIILIGHSYMAGVAALYAAKHPNKVEKLIQIGAIPPRSNPYSAQARKTYNARIDSLANARLENMKKLGQDSSNPVVYCQLYRQVNYRPYFYDFNNFAKLNPKICEISNEQPLHLNQHYAALFGSIGNWDWRNEIKKLKIPSLILHGEYDTNPIESAKEWAELKPKTTLITIPNAGHLPYIENPNDFYSAIEKFLD